MNARQSADIAGDDPVGREQETRQCHQRPMLGLCSVLGVAPQWIVVTDAVCVMPDVVARRLVAPRLKRVLDRNADPPAQQVQPLFGNFRKQIGITSHGGVLS